MKRPPATATCRHCGREFNKRDRTRNHIYCSTACGNSGRRRQRALDSVVPDTAADNDANYPGTEWGPLPPALLIRVAAHVLAAEYAAWATQQKARVQR